MKKWILALLMSLVLAGVCPMTAQAASGSDKLVAITFDDGPSKYTDGLLDELAERDVVVTFFMQGCNAQSYPDVVKKAYEAGHQIASHTYNHPQLTKLNNTKIQDQLTQTADILNNATGIIQEYMVRPPYGSVNERVLSQLNAPAILWSVDTLDWKSRDADAVYDHIVNDTKDGSIVLLHDLYDSSVVGALRGIDTLLEQGYELVTVDELLRRRGNDAADGTKYYSARGDTTLPGIAAPTVEAVGTPGGSMVTLTADPGTTIYYTTDGATPTSQSRVYGSPFLLEDGATVKAFAARNLNGARSRVTEIKPEYPHMEPPVITFIDGMAAITGTGELRYTLGGTLPTPSSPLYTQPIHMTPGTVLKALATQAGYTPSLPSALYYSTRGNLFTDVEPEDWFCEAADNAVSQELMLTENHAFYPESPATRRDVVTVLYGLAGCPESSSPVPFTDLQEDDPAYHAASWAIGQGILSGYADGTFRPDIAVTREQLAVMLCRAWNGSRDIRDTDKILGAFDDVDSLHNYARDAAAWAVREEIFDDMADKKLNPAGIVTRAQLAATALWYTASNTKPDGI